MKILFAGDLSSYGRTPQRLRALQSLGHEVKAVSYVTGEHRPSVDRESLLDRVRWKLRLPPDPAGANQALRAAGRAEKYDVVWIEKGNTVRPATLRALRASLPRAKIVACSEDDMYAVHNRTLWFTRCIPLYDVIFTTKVYNLEELKTLGARATALFIDAFAPEVHRPLTLTADERARFACEVGFIGTFEEDRARQMLFLAEKGITVTVWGNGWGDWQKRHGNLVVKNLPLFGDDFARAINATKINLGFLRKRNRDQTTSRSVEIPACGAFLLAERTPRHEDLFREGQEAEFFGSLEELLVKVRKFLADPAAREKIAAAGRARCLASGYDHASQLRQMLNTLESHV